MVARLDALVATDRFASRSGAIAAAVEEKLSRIDRGRLGRECVKLDQAFEEQLAIAASARYFFLCMMSSLPVDLSVLALCRTQHWNCAERPAIPRVGSDGGAGPVEEIQAARDGAAHRQRSLPHVAVRHSRPLVCQGGFL